MDNSTATRPYSRLKGDPYRAFEELPAEVRRALQESLVDWCSLRAREWHLHLLRQERLRPAQAASVLVQTIRRLDHAEVAAFARSWPKGAEAYPHLAAGATLQRYAGPEGIPAAQPLVIRAPQQRAKAPDGRAGHAPAERVVPAPAGRPAKVASGRPAKVAAKRAAKVASKRAAGRRSRR